jgi:hypothetical protein
MCLYDQYSANYLSELYYVIERNIENGFLSHAMYQELNLIAEAVGKQGITILDHKRIMEYRQVCDQK